MRSKYLFIVALLAGVGLLILPVVFAQTAEDRAKEIAVDAVGQAADIGISYTVATLGTGGMGGIVILLLLGIKKYRRESVELAATLIKSDSPNHHLVKIAKHVGQAAEKRLVAEMKKQGVAPPGV